MHSPKQLAFSTLGNSECYSKGLVFLGPSSLQDSPLLASQFLILYLKRSDFTCSFRGSSSSTLCASHFSKLEPKATQSFSLWGNFDTAPHREVKTIGRGAAGSQKRVHGLRVPLEPGRGREKWMNPDWCMLYPRGEREEWPVGDRQVSLSARGAPISWWSRIRRGQRLPEVAARRPNPGRSETWAQDACQVRGPGSDKVRLEPAKDHALLAGV